MLIYGSGMYGKRNHANGWGRCDNCGAFGKMRSYDARKYGHLYFIPLLPLDSPVRVIRECSNCNLGSHIPQDRLRELKRNIEDNIEIALSTRSQGKRMFVPATGLRETFDADGGQASEHCGIYLANSVEILYCLQMEDWVDHSIDTLAAANADFEACLVQGSAREFVGDSEAAAKYYRQLVGNFDFVQFPVFLGEFYRRWNHLSAARDLYEEAVTKWPKMVFFLEALLDIYTQRKDDKGLCATYERIFGIVPQLRTDKKFTKPYIKACKREKRSPMI